SRWSPCRPCSAPASSARLGRTVELASPTCGRWSRRVSGTYDRMVTQTAPGAAPRPAGEAGSGVAVPAPGALTATSVAAPRRPPDLLAELLARATSRYAA